MIIRTSNSLSSVYGGVLEGIRTYMSWVPTTGKTFTVGRDLTVLRVSGAIEHTAAWPAAVRSSGQASVLWTSCGRAAGELRA